MSEANGRQTAAGDPLENLLHENRRFAPSAEFAAAAVAQPGVYAEADADRPAFWAKQARGMLSWDKDFEQALDWSDAPFAKWFVGGELNAAYNALDRHVENGLGDRVAIHFEGEPGDTRTYTYAQLTEEVKRCANAFESLGVAKGDRVAVYLPMIPEAAITMLACARIGAVHSVVFGGFSADALRSRIDDAEAKLVVTADGTFRRGKPSALKPAVDEALSAPGHTVGNVVVVKRNGEPVDWHEGRDLWWADTVETASSEHTPVPHDSEHPLFILYTSGTTGKPKGVRLQHDCWAYMARAIEAGGLVTGEDVQYLWLPLAHVFGKVLTAGQIGVGHVTAVDGRIDKIIENLPIVRPTYMAAVPRIFEKVYNGVAAKARAGGGAKYKIFQWAAGVAREYAKVTQDNFRRTGKRSAPLGLSAKHAVADKLVFAKIREAFGGRLRAAVSGSAALAPDIGFFFSGAGVHILEGYGLTESSAASFVNPGEAYRTGTVGKPLPGTEVRIADDGEILLRGPGIMQGYHGLPEKTAEVLEADGWFHTGDIGELSPDGYLRITDRKKDLIKTSGGKYIAPAEVEGQFKAVCPFVSNILVHGADRNFCTALIALDEPTVMGWAEENGLSGKPYADIVATPQMHELIEGYVQRLNEGLQRWQTIKKFRILPRDLDVEHGELTPSLKLKRPVVEREYRHLIDEMYEGSREA